MRQHRRCDMRAVFVSLMPTLSTAGRLAVPPILWEAYLFGDVQVYSFSECE